MQFQKKRIHICKFIISLFKEYFATVNPPEMSNMKLKLPSKTQRAAQSSVGFICSPRRMRTRIIYRDLLEFITHTRGIQWSYCWQRNGWLDMKRRCGQCVKELKSNRYDSMRVQPNDQYSNYKWTTNFIIAKELAKKQARVRQPNWKLIITLESLLSGEWRRNARLRHASSFFRQS